MLERNCINDVSDEDCDKCMIYGIIPCCPRSCHFLASKSVELPTNREYNLNDSQLFVYTENIMRKTLKKYINELMKNATKDEYPIVSVDEWTLKHIAEALVNGEIEKCKK